jgi:hypothetical protein
MRARVPLDVDLEDRLVYGLTPMRLAYAVLAGLGAMALWSAQWLVAPVRLPLVVLVLAAGAVLAYGRFSGRPADEWLVDSIVFVVCTRRLMWRSRKRPRSSDDAELAEAASEAA